MSTILMPGEPTAAAGPPPRMLHIGADLLPPEIAEARFSRRLRRLVLISVGAFTVLVVLGIAVATGRTAVARGDLNDAENEAGRLTQQQRQYSEVVRVQAESAAVRAKLTTLLASDLPWSTLLTSLQDSAPPGVLVLSAAGTLSPEPAAAASTTVDPATAGRPGADPAAAPSPAVAVPSRRPVGTLVVTGTGSTQTAVAAYLDALGKVPGLANPLLNSTNLANGAQQFTMQLDITDAALGGRYTAPNASKEPGK